MSNLNIYQYLSNLDSLKSILTTLISIAVGSFTTYKVLNTVFKREQILFNNLQRKIKVFYPPYENNKEMEVEFEEIANNRLFNADFRTCDIRKINNIDSKSLVIIGFGSDFNFFESVYVKATQYKIPIIIYTYGKSRVLEPKHWDVLNRYQWYSVCNTPIRLISDIFTILSTFTYEDK
ncbi:hypothetical protein IQ243_22175 [Nostocales cyanobacterium LEGE 11386]|nr:hypothetical protein [Nostocales cyanobacterium LEGE 11386]